MHRRVYCLLFLICLGIMFVSPFAVSATMIEPQWTGDHDLRARFLIDEKDPAKAALYMKMASGWHTYWVVPGEAGLPPRFSWTDKKNIKKIDVFYPVPQRFNEHGFTTFGYADEVIVPLQIKPDEAHKDTTARLTLEAMVCKDICIPKTLDITFDARQTIFLENGDQDLLARAYETLPRKNVPDLALQNVLLSDRHLTARVTPPKNAHVRDIEGMDAFVVIYDTPDDAQKAPQDGIVLTGPIQKSVNHDNGDITFIVPRNADMSDLNLYTQGKIVRIVIKYRDYGLVQDIYTPAQSKGYKETAGQKLRKRVKQYKENKQK
jgi:DsbC/DsbD-like thiol-disulfide interchange protein